jgi:hypothetical protein
MRGNIKIILLFGSLSEMNEMETLFLSIFSKPKFLFSQNWEEYME